LRLLVLECGGPDVLVCGIATCPSQAIALAKIHEPDLALVDIRLEHGTSGVDAARELGKMGCRSIFVTAYQRDAQAVEGAIGTLIKPYASSDIKAVLKIAEDVLAGRPPGSVPASFVLF
jgi:DNA-binding NarL/FixJ family response regulator